jgi:hypothetical protein
MSGLLTIGISLIAISQIKIINLGPEYSLLNNFYSRIHITLDYELHISSLI